MLVPDSSAVAAGCLRIHFLTGEGVSAQTLASSVVAGTALVGCVGDEGCRCEAGEKSKMMDVKDEKEGQHQQTGAKEWK